MNFRSKLNNVKPKFSKLSPTSFEKKFIIEFKKYFYIVLFIRDNHRLISDSVNIYHYNSLVGAQRQRSE